MSKAFTRETDRDDDDDQDDALPELPAGIKNYMTPQGYARLRADLGLTILFISHDLGVMQQVTDFVYVMRGGRVVEAGPTSRVLREPEHPYTRALLDAVPGAAAATTSAAAAPTAAEVPGD